jgi:CheY-like chemotaxis protein
MATPLSTPSTVLIVDDNRDLLLLVTETLHLLGDFTVVTAENGADGLARAVALRPDCLVIDIKMPRLDGYQLIRALRGDPETEDIPLVILTALTQEHYRLAGLLIGADQFLVKPVKPDTLVEAIQAAISLSQDERTRRQRAILAELPVEEERG